MTIQSVHWHEGMFLWPQHMQLAERFLLQEWHLSHRWDVHYNWGLRRPPWQTIDLSFAPWKPGCAMARWSLCRKMAA
jgi:predicted component of type VI protein secretion system